MHGKHRKSLFTKYQNSDKILLRGEEMIAIRPVSDLRNKYTEIENLVTQNHQPVFLTKNGYGTMVVLSIDQYSALTDKIEMKLDEADAFAKSTDVRYGAKEVFDRARVRIGK